MYKVKDKNKEFEILISTMNRTSLNFLHTMFSKVNLHNYNVLIINQTIKNHFLYSNLKTVRIINTLEKGLSKSRNLAIKNAKKEICLFADDDIVFKKGFDRTILNAHQKYDDAIITFQTETPEGNLYWKYPSKTKKHNHFISRKTLSIEISFKKSKLNNLAFDERFGLGSIFEDAENYIFLMEAKKRAISTIFVNKTISIHPPFSTSDEVNSDRLLYARAAVNYKLRKKIAYLWLFKFVFFLFRKKYISTREILPKLKVGLEGINDFKKN